MTKKIRETLDGVIYNILEDIALAVKEGYEDFEILQDKEEFADGYREHIIEELFQDFVDTFTEEIRKLSINKILKNK